MKLLVNMVAEQGVTLQHAETTHRFAGVRLHRVVEQLEHQHSLTLPESFIPDYRRRLLIELERSLQAMPNIDSALQQLTLPCCVASNAPLAKIRLCLRVTELQRYFADNVFSAYEVNSWKPEPGLILAAAEGMGVAPQQCLVVEDSPSGIDAALEAGTSVIAYRRPDVTDTRVLHMSDHRELPALIEQFN